MTKAVLTTKVISTYDDLPEERYHFPRAYLHQLQQAVGDFIIYYEPRRSSADAMQTFPAAPTDQHGADISHTPMSRHRPRGGTKTDWAMKRHYRPAVEC